MEYTTASVIKGQKEGNVRTFKISDQSVDRDDEVVVLKNMNLTEFQKNPVIMYLHSANRYPDPDLVVGQSPKIWFEDTKSELFSDAEFDVKGTGDLVNVLAKKVLYKIDDGQLKMSSIGFGTDWKTYGRGDKSKGENPDAFYIRKSELHEWSVVPVPANRNASLQKAFERSVKYNVDEWRQFIDKQGLKGEDLDQFLKNGFNGAPELLYLESEAYKAPSAITFHFDIPKAVDAQKSEPIINTGLLLRREALIRQSKI